MENGIQWSSEMEVSREKKLYAHLLSEWLPEKRKGPFNSWVDYIMNIQVDGRNPAPVDR